MNRFLHGFISQSSVKQLFVWSVHRQAFLDKGISKRQFLTQLFPRYFSNKDDQTEEKDGKSTEPEAEGVESLETGLPETEESSVKEEVDMKEILRIKEEEVADLTNKYEEERKKVLLALAESENLRSRFSRELSQTKKFAVQSFVQSLLTCLDNLDRAVGSVPDSLLGKKEEVHDPGEVYKALSTLLDGVKLTQKEFGNVLQSNGVQRYDPIDEPFDPNKHMARFELEDQTRRHGTVGIVTLCGYMMHDRVIRPAEVGVIKNPKDQKSEGESETEASETSSDSETDANLNKGN